MLLFGVSYQGYEYTFSLNFTGIVASNQAALNPNGLQCLHSGPNSVMLFYDPVWPSGATFV